MPILLAMTNRAGPENSVKAGPASQNGNYLRMATLRPPTHIKHFAKYFAVSLDPCTMLNSHAWNSHEINAFSWSGISSQEHMPVIDDASSTGNLRDDLA